MKLVNNHLQAVLNALKKRKRFYAKVYGKNKANKLIKVEEIFLIENMMPPKIASVTSGYDTVSLFTMAHIEREFDVSEVEQALAYIDTQIIEPIKNPDSNQDTLYRVFVRTTVLAYMMEALIDVLAERDVVEWTPQFIKDAKSHQSALINFINSVNERHQRTGKWGFSGSNHAEIEEFKQMFIGLLRACHISEYYAAWILIFNRFMVNRLGGKVEDWNGEN